MDRLPVELLAHIATFLEASHEGNRPVRTTNDLAIISRVSKILNEIVTPLLYLEPRLGTKKSAELWARTYSRKVNPWNVMHARDVHKDVVGPRKITLVPVYGNAADRRLNKADEDATPVSLFRYNTILTDFFFRTLPPLPLMSPSSTQTSYQHSLVRTARIDIQLSTSRSTFSVEIEILPSSSSSKLIAISGGEWQDPLDWIDVLGDSDYADYVLERLLSEEGMPDDEMDRITGKVAELALVKFSVFDLHYLEDGHSFDYLSDVLNRRTPTSTTPFANLNSLKLTIFSNAEIALIFLTPLFPHLLYLTLDGYMYTTNHFVNDLEMLRYSITQRQGTIRLPIPDSDPNDPTLATIFVGCSWDTPTENEMEDYPWKPYRGPNLSLLDLSLCSVHRGQVN